MKESKRLWPIVACGVMSASAWGQTSMMNNDSLPESSTMQDVVVRATTGSRMKHQVTNTEMIGPQELVRAACCNLGESFTTNPSVDVNESDAATGARQIKLLGLSGTYVQMLTENVPNLRGAALPFGLGYVPGPWMHSISVSKGAASVRNGYESVTGHINIEYLKPQSEDQLSGNLYYDIRQRLEANVMANLHATNRFGHGLLLHVENRQSAHDGNGDGFMDMPKLRQYNGMYRWAYVGPKWISQFYVKGLHEERKSGQTHHAALTPEGRYAIGITTNRFEAQWKNALILDPEHNSSLALMLQGSWHDADTYFGKRTYDVLQKNGFAQLMYETDFTPHHSLSVGASLNHDYYKEHAQGLSTLAVGAPAFLRAETTPGLYAQYTYKLGETLTAIAGLRWDRSSHYGGFWTPRVHVKYTPTDWFTLRASAGKGYRTAHALAENVSLMATGRDLVFDANLQQEEAWNYGFSTSFTLPMADKLLELNAEYYYTDFQHQLVIDPYTSATQMRFGNLQGKSYSHTVQVDAKYPVWRGLDATAGFRFSDAKTTYADQLQWRPLTARYKGMLSLSYKTPLELWQFDVTSQLIGPSRLYDGTRSPVYAQLSAQVTREFRYFSVYIGGENLTNYEMKHPIIGASNPWSKGFDATQIWGPTEGAMAYVGVRFKLTKN